MATSKCLPKRKGMGWALLSWGLRARARSGHIVPLGVTSGAVRPERTRPTRKRERAYETPGGVSRHVRATEPERNRAEGNTSAPPGWILARVLAQHDEAATIGRIAAREGRFSSHRHLPWTRCPSKLLHAIREEDGAVAPRAVIATTGKEGMRTF